MQLNAVAALSPETDVRGHSAIPTAAAKGTSSSIQPVLKDGPSMSPTLPSPPSSSSSGSNARRRFKAAVAAASLGTVATKVPVAAAPKQHPAYGQVAVDAFKAAGGVHVLKSVWHAAKSKRSDHEADGDSETEQPEQQAGEDEEEQLQENVDDLEQELQELEQQQQEQRHGQEQGEHIEQEHQEEQL